jgi:hypothetical protein
LHPQPPLPIAQANTTSQRFVPQLASSTTIAYCPGEHNKQRFVTQLASSASIADCPLPPFHSLLYTIQPQHHCPPHYAGINCIRFQIFKIVVMKKILQALALILLSASLVYAGASSHLSLQEKCNREWEYVLKHKESVEEKPATQRDEQLATKSLLEFLIK